MQTTEPAVETAPEPTGRDSRREIRRNAILDVAEKSFLDLGYSGTTMSSIAATLGGSKGTLWSYFPSKEVLFAAVLDRATADFQGRLSVILNRHDPIDAAIGAFCRQFVAKITSPPAIALHRLVIGEASRFPEIGRIFYDRAPHRTQRVLADFLADAIDRGLLRGVDPLRAAQHLTSLCMATCHYQLILGILATTDEQATAADADCAAAAFLLAYAPSPGRHDA